MIVIGETADGFLIEATENEVQEILNAVLGTHENHHPKIGTKLPAVDYARTIKHAKYLGESDAFKHLKSRIRDFNRKFDALEEDINKAKDL